MSLSVVIYKSALSTDASRRSRGRGPALFCEVHKQPNIFQRYILQQKPPCGPTSLDQFHRAAASLPRSASWVWEKDDNIRGSPLDVQRCSNRWEAACEWKRVVSPKGTGKCSARYGEYHITSIHTKREMPSSSASSCEAGTLQKFGDCKITTWRPGRSAKHCERHPANITQSGPALERGEGSGAAIDTEPVHQCLYIRNTPEPYNYADIKKLPIQIQTGFSNTTSAHLLSVSLQKRDRLKVVNMKGRVLKS